MGESIYPVIKGISPVTAAGIGVTDDQYNCVRRNGYPDHQINLCIRGEGVLKVDGREYRITEGMSFFLAKNVPHEYYGTDKPWTLKWVTFTGFSCDIFLAKLGLQNHAVVTHKDISGLEAAYSGIYGHLKKNGEYDALLADSYVFRYLAEYHISMKKSLETPSGSAAVSRAMRYISEHFSEDMSLSEISDFAGVSEQYLCRVFKRRTGMTPFDYVTGVRISCAKELLAGGTPIKRTAELSGFNDTSYFCKVFKAHEGVSPGKFL
ncbi:MAG: AraC family transcriptional regulator [Oscillospiraceae bacterium]|nr:AraC family transcriptional regulator [Oscillospiraceae bacterium]